MVTLYSTNCPRCLVLEAKLQNAGIEYQEVNDINIMSELGIMTAPMLDVDGKMLSFKAAIDWVNRQGGAA